MTYPTATDRSIDSSQDDRPPATFELSAPQGAWLIAILVCLAYLPALNGKFILDDDILLTDSTFIAAPNGLYWFWFTNKPIDFYPVSNTTLWIEWRLWGMHPTGYHVTNLLLHFASTLLVWAILRKLLVPGAFLAALLFAVHPVNVEAVAWIAQRKDLLATVFFLLTILWYLKADEACYPAGQILPGGTRSSVCPPTIDKWYRLSLLAFTLAMLSKGTPAILPVVLLGLARWRRQRITWIDLRRSVPFFLVAAALTAINIWCQNRMLDEPLRSGYAERFAGAGTVTWFYLSKALLPINLIFIYPFWHIQTGSVLWWLPLLAAMAVTALLVLRACAHPAIWSSTLLFAWGFFCVALLPVMGFTDVGFMKFSLVADHYQHLAIIGVVALVAAAWSVWHNRMLPSLRPVAMVAAGAVLVLLTFLTWQQCRLYSSPMTLYRATLEKNPGSWMIHGNLAVALNDAGQPEEAIKHCQEALRLKPNYPEAFGIIGNAEVELGNFELAAENYRQTLLLRPIYADVYNKYGIVLGRLDRLPEAIAQFKEALNIDPNYVDAHSNLALALFKSDRIAESIDEFETAVRLEPRHPRAHAGLAAALAHEGRLQQAVEHYQQALKLKPDYTDAYARLAKLYAQLHQTAEAVDTAQHAIDLAHSQGQTALEGRIRAWLDDYLTHQEKPGDAGGTPGR